MGVGVRVGGGGTPLPLPLASLGERCSPDHPRFPALSRHVTGNVFQCRESNTPSLSCIRSDGGKTGYCSRSCSRIRSISWPEFRDAIDNSPPEKESVNVKIGVDQSITHTCHLTPGNIGILLPQRKRDLLCRLTDDLKFPDDGTLRPVIGQELIVGHAGGKLRNLFERRSNL